MSKVYWSWTFRELSTSFLVDRWILLDMLLQCLVCIYVFIIILSYILILKNKNQSSVILAQVSVNINKPVNF